jgi:polar amino acid transport system substrate-binding protein
VAVGWVLVALWLTACSSAQTDSGFGRQPGVLRIGMDASYPPFEWIDPTGNPTGFDVALAEELGRRLGLEVQFVANLPYDGLYDALAVGRVDAVISALVVNPDRTADFEYSTPYFDAGQVLVVREGETAIGRMADLAGHTLAVEFGSQGDLFARAWSRRLEGFTILTYQTPQEALEAVENGTADAALVDHVSALASAMPKAEHIPHSGRLTIAGDPVSEELYAVATRREDGRLLRAINRALAAMQADGTLDSLRDDWLNNSSYRPDQESQHHLLARSAVWWYNEHVFWQPSEALTRILDAALSAISGNP